MHKHEERSTCDNFNICMNSTPSSLEVLPLEGACKGQDVKERHFPEEELELVWCRRGSRGDEHVCPQLNVPITPNSLYKWGRWKWMGFTLTWQLWEEVPRLPANLWKSEGFFKWMRGFYKIQWLIKNTCFPWLGAKHNLSFVFPLFLLFQH